MCNCARLGEPVQEVSRFTEGQIHQRLRAVMNGDYLAKFPGISRRRIPGFSIIARSVNERQWERQADSEHVSFIQLIHS
jgi:hypothetical protein